MSLSTPETRTLAAIFTPDCVPNSKGLTIDPYAVVIGPDSTNPEKCGYRSGIRLAEVVHTDVQDVPSAWDLAESLGADPTAAAAELFADLDAETQEACRLDAEYFRSPEPATPADAVQYWIECDPDNENLAIKRALDKVGLCYVTISPYVHPEWTDAIVRWIEAA